METTNVKAEDLNYHRYKMEEYDQDIKANIPGYEELHKNIESVIKSNYNKSDKLRILELGIGTGLTALRILKMLPDSKYIGIDFSDQMLKGAQIRLNGFNTKFVLGDYAKVKFDGEFDIIVSVIGIHHQIDQGKRLLFKKIFNHLKGKGMFIFGDLVTYKDPAKAKEMNNKTTQHLIINAKDENRKQEWLDHWNQLNILATLEDQINWLKGVGFSRVEVKYNYLNTSLIIALR